MKYAPHALPPNPTQPPNRAPNWNSKNPDRRKSRPNYPPVFMRIERITQRKPLVSTCFVFRKKFPMIRAREWCSLAAKNSRVGGSEDTVLAQSSTLTIVVDNTDVWRCPLRRSLRFRLPSALSGSGWVALFASLIGFHGHSGSWSVYKGLSLLSRISPLASLPLLKSVVLLLWLSLLISFLCLSLSSFLLVNPLCFPMDPPKGSFREVLLSNPSKNDNGIDLPVEADSIPSKAEKPRNEATKQTFEQGEKSTNIPVVDKGKKPMGEEPETQEKTEKKTEEDMEMEEYIKQINKARSKALKMKEASLVGRVFGEPIEFAKIKMKIAKEWRFILGEFQFIPKANHWFELRFANPIDKKKVWEGRPFHVFGQVLILRNWSPNFDPFTENISRIDTWVRIPALPVELCNAEAIEAIVKRHKLGSFVKYDINNERKSGNKYPRFCINVDMAGKVNGEVFIPEGDDEDEFTKYNVWFEDFPAGCGNCGLMDHTYIGCPLRVPKPKKIQITIIRTTEKGIPETPDNKSSQRNEKEDDWKPAGNKTNPTPVTTSKDSSTKPYLADKSGVKVDFVYIDKNDKENSTVAEDNTNIAHDAPNQDQVKDLIAAEHSKTKQEAKNISNEDAILDIQRIMESDDIVEDDDENVNYFDEDFLTEEHDEETEAEKLPSNVSFHSMNSTDGSVILKMESLKVQKDNNSISQSSKRMLDEDDMDTASSDAHGGNKKKKAG